VARVGNIGSVSPAEALSEFLRRHDELCRKRMSEISEYYLKCKFELHRANGVWTSLLPEQQANMQAMEKLCAGGKTLWDIHFEKARQYRCVRLHNGDKEVRHVDYNPSFNRVRIFRSSKRCDCRKRIAFLAPCWHEICADDMKFNLERWPERFLLRNTLETSLAAPIEFTHHVEIGQSSGIEGSHETMAESNDGEFGNFAGDDDNGNIDLASDDEDEKENSSRLANTGQSLASLSENETGRSPVMAGSHETVAELNNADFYNVGVVDDNNGIVDIASEDEGDKENRSQVANTRQAQIHNFDDFTFGQGVHMVKEFNEIAMKSKNEAKMFGMLATIMQAEKNDQIDASFEDAFRRYLSTFSCYRKTSQLYSTISGNGEIGQLLPRTSVSGKPRTKRLKPAVETMLASAKRSSPLCSFCSCNSHNSRNCEKLLGFGGVVLSKKEEVSEFAENVGDPSVFLVEKVPGSMQSMFVTIDWDLQKSLPDGAFHIVVRKLYFGSSEQVVESRFASRNPTCSVQENILELDFLKQGGELLPVADPKQRFYKVKHFRTIVNTHIAGKKKLIHCLSKPRKRPSSDFIFY
jgi:hypothetical protein